MIDAPLVINHVDVLRHDYRRFLAEYGITDEQMRSISEIESDQVDWPCEKLVLLRSPIEGLGLFAAVDVRAGEVLALARVDERRTLAGRFTNHAPYPNGVFSMRSDGNVELVAARNIEAGEEVTVDYRQAARINGSGLLPIRSEVESTLRQKIELLQNEILLQPQIEIPLKHYFTAGVYAREMDVPAGALWVGKTHKLEQINILSKGDMSIRIHDGVIRVRAPYTVVCPPGIKRIGFAHEDSVWTVILSTYGVNLSELDLDQVEELYVADSETAYLEFLSQVNDS